MAQRGGPLRRSWPTPNPSRKREGLSQVTSRRLPAPTPARPARPSPSPARPRRSCRPWSRPSSRAVRTVSVDHDAVGRRQPRTDTAQTIDLGADLERLRGDHAVLAPDIDDLARLNGPIGRAHV